MRMFNQTLGRHLNEATWDEITGGGSQKHIKDSRRFDNCCNPSPSFHMEVSEHTILIDALPTIPIIDRNQDFWWYAKSQNGIYQTQQLKLCQQFLRILLQFLADQWYFSCEFWSSICLNYVFLLSAVKLSVIINYACGLDWSHVYFELYGMLSLPTSSFCTR